MRREKIGIVATKLPKMRGKKKKKKNCGNQVPENGRKKKKKKNYGNQVAEIVREEREIFNRNFGMPKKKIVASKIGRVNHLTFSSPILILQNTWNKFFIHS